jgi:hypothetical protein
MSVPEELRLDRGNWKVQEGINGDRHQENGKIDLGHRYAPSFIVEFMRRAYERSHSDEPTKVYKNGYITSIIIYYALNSLILLVKGNR